MFLRNKKSKTTVKVCRETQPVPSLARSSGLPCQWPYSLCFSVDLIATKTLPPGAIGPGHELKLCEEHYDCVCEMEREYEEEEEYEDDSETIRANSSGDEEEESTRKSGQAAAEMYASAIGWGKYSSKVGSSSSNSTGLVAATKEEGSQIKETRKVTPWNRTAPADPVNDHQALDNYDYDFDFKDVGDGMASIHRRSKGRPGLAIVIQRFLVTEEYEEWDYKDDDKEEGKNEDGKQEMDNEVKEEKGNEVHSEVNNKVNGQVHEVKDQENLEDNIAKDEHQNDVVLDDEEVARRAREYAKHLSRMGFAPPPKHVGCNLEGDDNWGFECPDTCIGWNEYSDWDFDSHSDTDPEPAPFPVLQTESDSDDALEVEGFQPTYDSDSSSEASDDELDFPRLVAPTPRCARFWARDTPLNDADEELEDTVNAHLVYRFRSSNNSGPEDSPDADAVMFHNTFPRRALFSTAATPRWRERSLAGVCEEPSQSGGGFYSEGEEEITTGADGSNGGPTHAR